MFKTYLRCHDGGRMECVSRGLAPQDALPAFRHLLARDDLAGQPWGVVLRDEWSRVTVLYSRFDTPAQRLLPTDAIDLMVLMENAGTSANADILTRQIVSDRPGCAA